jgi:hypothetical protein
MATYKIYVQTSTADSAGTDADVFITLYGDAGSTGEYLLDNAEDNFERGDTDEFLIDARDFGNLQRIRLRHDNGGDDPGWKPDGVRVVNMENNREWNVPIGEWMASDEPPYAIDRIFWVR